MTTYDYRGYPQNSNNYGNIKPIPNNIYTAPPRQYNELPFEYPMIVHRGPNPQ